MVRNDELTVEQVAALTPERIVISPGPCTPNEAGISVPVIRGFAGRVPTLREIGVMRKIGGEMGVKPLVPARVAEGYRPWRWIPASCRNDGNGGWTCDQGLGVGPSAETQVRSFTHFDG